MDKEQAGIYVFKSLNIEKTASKGFQYKLLIINLIFIGISALLYRGLVFIIIVSITASLDILFTIAFAKRKLQLFKATLLLIIQKMVFCVAANLIVFGMYMLVQKFVLWEYIVSIAIQLFAFAINFILEKKYAKGFKYSDDILKAEGKAGSVAGFSSALGLILCRIFSPSLSVTVMLLASLLNLMVCLMSFAVMMSIHKAYLIKKYNLNIEQNLEK